MKTKKIYKLINQDNNKLYIGKTTQTLEKRLSDHITTAKRWAKDDFYHKKHPYKSRLYPAMNLHGYDKFKIELVEVVADDISLEEREQFWIAKFNTLDDSIGYNISPGGLGGPLFKGHTHTQDIRNKISLMLKGKKQTHDFVAKRHKKMWCLYQSLQDGNTYTIQEILPPSRRKIKAPQCAVFNNYKIWRYNKIYYINLGPARNRLPVLSLEQCHQLNAQLNDIGFVSYKQYTKYKGVSKELRTKIWQESAKVRQKAYWDDFIAEHNLDIENYKQIYYKYQANCPNRHLELIFKLNYNQIRNLNRYLGLSGGKSGHKPGKIVI